MRYLKHILYFVLVSHVLCASGQTKKCVAFHNAISKEAITYTYMGVIDGGNVTANVDGSNGCFVILPQYDTLVIGSPGFDDLVIEKDSFLKYDSIFLNPEFRIIQPAHIKQGRKRYKHISIGRRHSVVYSEIELLPGLPAFITFSTHTLRKKLMLESLEFEINTNSYFRNVPLAVAIHPLPNSTLNDIKFDDVLEAQNANSAAYSDTVVVPKDATGWYKIQTDDCKMENQIYLLMFTVISNDIAHQVANWTYIHDSKLCMYDSNCICLKTNSKKSKYFGPYFRYQYPYKNSKYNYFRTNTIAPRIIFNFKTRYPRR